VWKTVGRLHKKLKIELPYDLYDLAIPLLGIYLKYCEQRITAKAPVQP
jgi:hypothetical protein